MRSLAASVSPAGFETTALGILDRRLRTDTLAPLAVALSGGGDSLALALIASAWAKTQGRPLLVLTVDHGLRQESAQWTARCRATALRLGAKFQDLSWEGSKPLRGLPAAARAARHGLLAEAARKAGAPVILMGHTADDLAESARMRAAGSTTPDPREWAPSPAWPEGRGVFLLRPLLGAGREEIRAWLRARSETWIDDPANGDLRFARARARATPDDGGPPSSDAPDGLADLALATETDAAGTLTIPRARLRHPAARAFVAMASLCAAGTARPPRSERAERLAERLAGEGTVALTLCGARIEADDLAVRFLRDAGEAERHGFPDLTAGPDGAVWDGRFEIFSEQPLLVRGVNSLRGRLPREIRTALGAFAPKVREGLPIGIHSDGELQLLVGQPPGAQVRALAYGRLLAACGAVSREP